MNQMVVMERVIHVGPRAKRVVMNCPELRVVGEGSPLVWLITTCVTPYYDRSVHRLSLDPFSLNLPNCPFKLIHPIKVLVGGMIIITVFFFFFSGLILDINISHRRGLIYTNNLVFLDHIIINPRYYTKY